MMDGPNDRNLLSVIFSQLELSTQKCTGNFNNMKAYKAKPSRLILTNQNLRGLSVELLNIKSSNMVKSNDI